MPNGDMTNADIWRDFDESADKAHQMFMKLSALSFRSMDNRFSVVGRRMTALELQVEQYSSDVENGVRSLPCQYHYDDIQSNRQAKAALDARVKAVESKIGIAEHQAQGGIKVIKVIAAIIVFVATVVGASIGGSYITVRVINQTAESQP